MFRRYRISFVIILVFVAALIWINLPDNPGIRIGEFERSLETQLGLDLRGGMQVLLEVDLPPETAVEARALQDARQILENRSNALGVSEVLFQVAGTRRIVGEFPGLSEIEEVIDALKETGQLEFVDMGDTPLPEGTVIETDLGRTVSEQVEPSEEDEPILWHTVMTGASLTSVGVTRDELGAYVIQFELDDEGSAIFAEHTTQNVGKYLAIVLDKRIISVPRIETGITEGSGIITGNFTLESSNALAVQLRYGSLPIPLTIVESRVIGPTLGEESLQKSILAGLIGLTVVSLFMILYYRLPGFVAVLAIGIFALITLALYKLIPITLTLPGVAGFMLSTGIALDANILIFERIREELRSGRSLHHALELGWKRAWPSIRDSNITSLITGGILFWFGSAFGATLVKGFAVTLFLGILISMFTAIVVTKSLMYTIIDLFGITYKPGLFGLK